MVNSSLTYEILMYLNSFYFGLFACCACGMGILKALHMPYNVSELTQDTIILIAVQIVETIRLFLGRRGNLAGHSPSVLVSILLTFPAALGITYLIAFQTHRLRLDYILCGLLLALQTAELFYAFLFVVTICRPPSYD